METKFTKGIWLREKTTVYALHQIGWDKGQPLMSNRFYLQVYPDYRVENCTEEAEANAKLIAAAPDLFKMLEDALHTIKALNNINVFYGGVSQDTIIIEIENVLKKATE